MGVADGMADVGVRLADHAMLGTSGGAWAAGALASGVSLDKLVATATRGKARRRPQPEIVEELFGDRRDARVSTVVVDRRSGRRQVLRAARVGVADAVGASSAAPGLFPAYEIGRRSYIDGGVYSPTAAHYSSAARLLVVVAPMAGPMLRPANTLFAGMARTEAAWWRARTGGRVLCIAPDAEVAAAAGSGWRSLLDPTTTQSVYRAARRLGRVRGKTCGTVDVPS
jgi:predicted acylesterase/phospholipase RssA